MRLEITQNKYEDTVSINGVKYRASFFKDLGSNCLEKGQMFRVGGKKDGIIDIISTTKT